MFIVEIKNFTTSQEPLTVGVGRSFQLNCTTPEATPKANVTWRFNDVTIATSAYYTVSSATLADDGVYACRVENVAGYKESLVTVTVLGMLLFIVFAEDNTVYSIQRSQLLLLIAYQSS